MSAGYVNRLAAVNAAHYDEPLLEFNCSTPDCPERAWSEDDLRKCEGCLERFCADHLTMLEGLPWCDGCRVCIACDEKAAALIDGVLVCAGHKIGLALCCDCKGRGVMGAGLVPMDQGDAEALASIAAGDFCCLLPLTPCAANRWALGTPVLFPYRYRKIALTGTAYVDVHPRLCVTCHSRGFVELWAGALEAYRASLELARAA